jgi:hypothetical protein
MTAQRLQTLVVSRNTGGTVKRFAKIGTNQDLVASDGEVKLSITFLSIEVNGLIPGVMEDSGLVRICTDRWGDSAVAG